MFNKQADERLGLGASPSINIDKATSNGGGPGSAIHVQERNPPLGATVGTFEDTQVHNSAFSTGTVSDLLMEANASPSVAPREF